MKIADIVYEMMLGKKYRCKETNRVAKVVGTPDKTKGEYILEYEDGTRAPMMPFELEVKYEPVLLAKKSNSVNPLRR